MIRSAGGPEQDPHASARHEGVRSGDDLRLPARERDIVGDERGGAVAPSALEDGS